jgi:hypothetical protein
MSYVSPNNPSSRNLRHLTWTAIEDRIFSINQPQAFFTMFGNTGGAASADLAMEAFEDDLKLTGRSVRITQSCDDRRLI